MNGRRVSPALMQALVEQCKNGVPKWIEPYLDDVEAAVLLDEKDGHSQRGWYDRDGIRQGGLIAFVRYFWKVLEPENQFVDGWPLWAMCLPYRTKITTSEGERYIGDIVESGWRGDVLSFNHRTSRPEWKPIVAHMKSPGQSLLTVKISTGASLCLTYNHPIYTVERGYVRADEVEVGDHVHLHSLPEIVHGEAQPKSVLRAPVLPRSSFAEGARSAYTQLQALWQVLLPMPVAATGGILFDEMLWLGKNYCGKHDLSQVRCQEDAVTAIVRETQIPDAVYNIEVLDNNNYFAEQILVHNCEHLEAVTFGEITRLLINVPPGLMKSMLVNVFWPAWEWGPIGKTHYRYVAFSYSSSLTERDNDRFRTLVTSGAYQRFYGPMVYKFEEADREQEVDGVILRNKTTIKVMNTKTGWKLASSVGGVATGERGDRIIIDDPHSVQEAESERVREETIRWFRESISSRFNNLDTGALVIIMQRVHYQDVSGVALGPEFDYCHMMVPWEFDPSRQGIDQPNAIGWIDPRVDPDNIEANAGEPAWPERFSEKAIARLRSEGGPYTWSSQFQQSPTPRGAEIFKTEWWQTWSSPNGEFPPFEYVVASLDGAFTEREENDPCAMTVWGTFSDPSIIDADHDGHGGKLWHTQTDRHRRIMLIYAWRKHLQFSMPRIARLHETTVIDGATWPAEVIKPGMSEQEVAFRNQRYEMRTRPKWGLMEWVEWTCINRKVSKLLIEAKANGIVVAQELRNRMVNPPFSIELVTPVKDKMARALAVQPTFANGLVYAPKRVDGSEFDWAEMVMDEAQKFPRDKHDDLVDTLTQALKHFRDRGLAMSREEITFDERERAMHKPQRKRLYDV